MNLKNRRYRIIYNANGKVFNTDKPQTEHFSLNITEDEKTYNVSVVPKTDVEFVKFSVDFPREYNSSEKMFVNGYQSWTDSFEYSAGERMHELTRLTEFIIKKSPFKSLGFSKSGDILFTDYPREKNIFYGWSYGYIRSGSTVEIFGSLSERSGYTRIEFNVKNRLVSVSKDLCGVVYKKETPLLSLAVIKGEYDSAFDEYFDKMGIKCRENKRRTGYTTWYNYYGGITEQIVNRDLAGIAESDIRFDCFQIDDGYQQAIGDWLKVNKSKFPNGMKKIAADIHGKNMIAGLWLAPFAAVRSSELYKNHPDWIIKDKFGKPYKTGPNWGGFYSLDIYNPQVREYLKNVFSTVLNDWGFDLVKLDFLYGACVLPMHNKTRGEIMCDAMDLLRDLCGDKLILGCGVPLMPAFGKVDYCRIGADIDLKWKRSRYCIREDVSTPHAVCNSIFRRSLNSRAWMNGPDVFLLRDNNIKYTFDERKLLAKINSIFGSLLFTSDDISKYNDMQENTLRETFAPSDIKINFAEFAGRDIMNIEYIENGRLKNLKFNIRSGERL